MIRKAVLLPGLAITGAALAATLLGCGGSVPPGADRPAAGQAAATGQAMPVPPTSSPPGPALQAADRTRATATATTPVDTRPDRPVTATSSPAEHSATPSSAPKPAQQRTDAVLADGLYTDAPDGLPHYIFALAQGTGEAITGSVNFLYQDGRIGTVGPYTGHLSGNGKLTITFTDGKDLTGTYAQGRLTLAGCSSVLAWANTAGCTFTYHGHVP